MKDKCRRCGRGKLNPTEICSKCNLAWQKYMRGNPLTHYPCRKESDERWLAFIRNLKRIYMYDTKHRCFVEITPPKNYKEWSIPLR